MLRGIPDVRAGEGRWNISQDVIGVPRPRGATLVGEGVGAERRADWGDRIAFRERITAWQPGQRIAWRFIFDDIAGWGFTDRYLMPDSPYFRVTDGGYTLTPLGAGRTRVTLETRYWIKDARQRLFGAVGRSCSSATSKTTCSRWSGSAPGARRRGGSDEQAAATSSS